MSTKLRGRKTRVAGTLIVQVAVAAALFLPGSAWAYIGPGAGLSIIGSVLAFLGAIVLAIVGFIWYPVRRMLKKRKAKLAQAGGAEGDAGGDGTAGKLGTAE